MAWTCCTGAGRTLQQETRSSSQFKVLRRKLLINLNTRPFRKICQCYSFLILAILSNLYRKSPQIVRAEITQYPDPVLSLQEYANYNLNFLGVAPCVLYIPSTKNQLCLRVLGSLPQYFSVSWWNLPTLVHPPLQIHSIKTKPNGSKDNGISCADHIHLAGVPAVLLCRIYVPLCFLSLNFFLRQGHLPGTRRWDAIRFTKCPLLI